MRRASHPAQVDDDGLAALLLAQGGVVRRDQLRRAGVPASRLGPGRDWAQVRTGAWAPVSGATSPARRAILAVAAERLVSGVDLVGAGTQAALAHGLPVLGRGDRVQVVERKPVRPRHHGGSREVHPDDVVLVGGVPFTSLARTGIDVARRGLPAGLVTLDAVLRRDVEREQLREVLGRSRRWPGRLVAAQAVDLADARSESALESLGRARCHEHGLPLPDLQVLIGDVDGPFARVDQCWEQYRTVAEADGAVKYTEPGALFAEKQREDRMRDCGWEVVRYTWDEALRRSDEVVGRMLRAFARGARRAA